MALKIDYINEQGVSIAYWIIYRYADRPKENICNVYLKGYVSQQVYLEEKDFVEELIINIYEDQYIQMIDEAPKGDLRPVLYKYVKLNEDLPIFKDAEDC